MSKISEYLEHLRKIEAKADQQSVSEFALELRKPTDVLLLQLKEAGIPKVSGSDNLTQTDKSVLLKHLQRQHGATRRRKIKITIESEEHKLIKKAAAQENGAELEVLRHFSAAVLFGCAIDPKFQKMVNLIVAKAVLVDALPPEKVGRPKRKELDAVGLRAAHRYWEMIDSGTGYEHAVQILGEEFHKSERQMMRLIAKHKMIVGDTPEIRESNRRVNEMVGESYKRTPNVIDHFSKLFERQVPHPELNLDDCLEHLVLLTGQLVAKENH